MSRAASVASCVTRVGILLGSATYPEAVAPQHVLLAVEPTHWAMREPVLPEGVAAQASMVVRLCMRLRDPLQPPGTAIASTAAVLKHPQGPCRDAATANIDDTFDTAVDTMPLSGDGAMPHVD